MIPEEHDVERVSWSRAGVMIASLSIAGWLAVYLIFCVPWK